MATGGRRLKSPTLGQRDDTITRWCTLSSYSTSGDFSKATFNIND
jgi:hypothetical protein